MSRPVMPAVGMTAAALILLAACGGGSGNGSSDKIQATQAGTTSGSPSATPSATSRVQRPVITFPGDTKTVYEDQHTGDSKKDAMLADESYANDSTYAAIADGKNRTPAMEFSHSGLALGGAADFVQGWLDKDNTWVGTIRYFNREVTLRSDGSAVVIHCSDESHASIKSRKTGKVGNSPATATSYVLYNERLQKNSQGVWILSASSRTVAPRSANRETAFTNDANPIRCGSTHVDPGHGVCRCSRRGRYSEERHIARESYQIFRTATW